MIHSIVVLSVFIRFTTIVTLHKKRWWEGDGKRCGGNDMAN